MIKNFVLPISVQIFTLLLLLLRLRLGLGIVAVQSSTVILLKQWVPFVTFSDRLILLIASEFLVIFGQTDDRIVLALTLPPQLFDFFEPVTEYVDALLLCRKLHGLLSIPVVSLVLIVLFVLILRSSIALAFVLALPVDEVPFNR